LAIEAAVDLLAAPKLREGGRATATLLLLLSPFVASSARADDDFLDPLDQALALSADHDDVGPG